MIEIFFMLAASAAVWLLYLIYLKVDQITRGQSHFYNGNQGVVK